jgi:ABC-type phosphate transport system permease subunit
MLVIFQQKNYKSPKALLMSSTSSLYKKSKFRPIEAIIEWIIRLTASFSVIIIFLIFIFIFREAGGLIFGTAKELQPKKSAS